MLTAPWGSLIATGVLVNFDRSVPEIWVFWRYWNDLAAMSDMVSYGAVTYGSSVSSLEVIVRVPYYAIAKILEDRERRRKERERMRNEAREQGLEQGLEQGINLVLNNPELEQYPELRERIKKDVNAAMEAGER